MTIGRIKRWHAEQEFGFIACEEAETEVFFHISDLKDKDLVPNVGDDVAFTIKSTKKGLQAKKVFYPNRPANLLVTTATPHPRDRMRSTGTKIFTTLMSLVVLAMIGFFGYQTWQKYQVKQLESLSNPIYSTKTPTSPKAISIKPTENFKCDGRQYCSQMSSLAEAKFFITHCPNTKMDGNHDGEPCENDSRLR